MDFTSWTPRMLSVLRIVTGLLFLEHGTGKLLGFPPSDHVSPTLFSLVGVRGALELVGGFLDPPRLCMKPRLPSGLGRKRRRELLGFLFSISMRTLAAGPDEPGFDR